MEIFRFCYDIFITGKALPLPLPPLFPQIQLFVFLCKVTQQHLGKTRYDTFKAEDHCEAKQAKMYPKIHVWIFLLC